ncbi:glutathionylspermidine synthase family protein [Oceanospirillum sanctuarii]|uniref:glutathionylspermidine synthase family protein n=1 Tax=Oceanospirillum sanctuarii TaxID=1434821 RepID=UPI000A3A260C|nr:glutathionylspermidine synthase family protein [Oceanospirillum sanctuarii]
MFRRNIDERPDLAARAEEFGFHFASMYGEKYWDESAFYQFSLRQIEDHLEDPTEELHQMCLEVVKKVVRDDDLMRRFKIPESQWDLIRSSWQNREPSLYSRFDFAYDGKNPAKLYENNADTPTSLYETGFWQWLWLSDQVDRGELSRRADQYNSVQDKLILRFKELAAHQRHRGKSELLYFACCKDTVEDRGTVQYLQDCAAEAGVKNRFVYVEDIGVDEEGQFIDLEDQPIRWMFKLYPWEFMFVEAFGELLGQHDICYLEPPWKAILSNKALLPMLWRMFPDHPNLLPAFFDDETDKMKAHGGRFIKKPIFSREGANVSLIAEDGEELTLSEGSYGEEGFIYQLAHFPSKFGENYTIIGSWLVNDQPAGISMREDSGPVTQDMSRFIPHIILD